MYDDDGFYNKLEKFSDELLIKNKLKYYSDITSDNNGCNYLSEQYYSLDSTIRLCYRRSQKEDPPNICDLWMFLFTEPTLELYKLLFDNIEIFTNHKIDYLSNSIKYLKIHTEKSNIEITLPNSIIELQIYGCISSNIIYPTNLISLYAYGVIPLNNLPESLVNLLIKFFGSQKINIYELPRKIKKLFIINESYSERLCLVNLPESLEHLVIDDRHYKYDDINIDFPKTLTDLVFTCEDSWLYEDINSIFSSTNKFRNKGFNVRILSDYNFNIDINELDKRYNRNKYG